MSAHERTFVEGFEWGFKSGYIAGTQDGYAQGYDDATRALKEAGF
jgi:flagellar biosynthesis/type III secretory pathway protein FliH